MKASAAAVTICRCEIRSVGLRPTRNSAGGSCQEEWSFLPTHSFFVSGPQTNKSPGGISDRPAKPHFSPNRGDHNSAQGIAQGLDSNLILSPEGAITYGGPAVGRGAALSALNLSIERFPERCPGLACFAPERAEESSPALQCVLHSCSRIDDHPRIQSSVTNSPCASLGRDNPGGVIDSPLASLAAQVWLRASRKVRISASLGMAQAARTAASSYAFA